MRYKAVKINLLKVVSREYDLQHDFVEGDFYYGEGKVTVGDVLTITEDVGTMVPEGTIVYTVKIIETWAINDSPGELFTELLNILIIFLIGLFLLYL